MSTKRTKIVATAGPATREPEVLEAMAAEGADVFRLNFSHGTATEHRETVTHVRRIATGTGRNLALLQDLQGPKLRVGRFPDGGVDLEAGQRFVFSLGGEEADLEGTPERTSLSHPGLGDDIEVGQVLLLDDGHLRMRATRISPGEIETEVEVGGTLESRKGVNVPGAHLSVEALTEKDLADLSLGLELGVDWVAKSFVRRREDVESTRRELERLGSPAKLMAKIETPAAVERFDEILEAADGVMVARGDLGVEMAPEEVPVVQKHLIGVAHDAGKPVITATQMLESMTEHSRPTRAEASDVANAVLDGTDAVMLSAETASGRYPVEVVETMASIVQEADRSETPGLDQQFLNETFRRVDQSIAYGALFTAFHLRCAAIVALTESGSTALWMSRHDIDIPIYALTPSVTTQRRLALYRNVRPLHFSIIDDRDRALAAAERLLIDRSRVRHGDLIVLTCGEPMGQPGGTNTLKIVRVTDEGVGA
jgi:pyruvate kinase